MFYANQLICLHSQITNQNMQKTIENADKITFNLGRMYRPSHRAFAVEKTPLTENQCGKWYFAFPWKFLHFQVVDIIF